MVYTKGNLIQTADFNGFVGTPTGLPANANKCLQPFASDVEATARVAAIYGIGYGQRGYGQIDVNLSNLSLSDSITNENWLTLRQAILNSATHQGISTTLLPPASDLEDNDLIVAHDGITNSYNFPQMITNIDNISNRFNASSMAFTAGPTFTRSIGWVTQITITLDATFASEDQARYFFNSGGSLQINPANISSATPQDLQWQTILTSYVQSVALNYTTTTCSGSRGVVSPIGYWDLTDTLTPIYTGTNIGDGAYSSNDVVVSARRNGTIGTNGGNGSVVTFQVVLSDQHTNPFYDFVSGAVIATYSWKTTNLTIPTPTWSSAGWSGS